MNRIKHLCAVIYLLCLSLWAVEAQGQTVLFSDDFSTDNGWTGYEAGYWQRGSATAGGGTLHGNPDPASDHSLTADNFLIGVNIGGDFATTINGAHYLTSPIVNCTGQTVVSVRFWRWLNTWGASSCSDWVEVYDGTTWVRVFYGEFISDNAWVQRTYDVSKYAANNPNFQVRFKFQSFSDTAFPGPYSGWNVDDFEVVASPGLGNPVTDPDFEANSTAWQIGSSGGVNGYVLDTLNWKSSNDGSLYIYTLNNSNLAVGDYWRVSQSVDLTNVNQILFDARNADGTHVELRVLIDGSVVWSQSAIGISLNQQIDVSALSGPHDLEFREHVVTAGSTVPSEHVYFDNVRIVAATTGEIDWESFE